MLWNLFPGKGAIYHAPHYLPNLNLFMINGYARENLADNFQGILLNWKDLWMSLVVRGRFDAAEKINGPVKTVALREGSALGARVKLHLSLKLVRVERKNEAEKGEENGQLTVRFSFGFSLFMSFTAPCRKRAFPHCEGIKNSEALQFKSFFGMGQSLRIINGWGILLMSGKI